MPIRANPNRMELIRLRRRLGVAVRGHRLLKDKLEGLIKEFVKFVKEYREKRLELDRNLPEVMKLFALAALTSSETVVDNALAQVHTPLELSVAQKNVMGVNVPRFQARFGQAAGTYSFLDTPPELDLAVAGMREYFPKIVALAELENTLRLLVAEIEKTRRRVNALEYVMIPRFQETIRFIKNKLDENERSSTTRLMKIKEMRLEQERQASQAARQT